MSLHSSSFGPKPTSGRWVHLKHRISKREYKVVLSKTYVGTILLMHMYQGKGRWGFKSRSASFDLASPVHDYQIVVRSVQESIYPSLPNNYTTMVPSSTSHERARHSTHTYLGKF